MAASELFARASRTPAVQSLARRLEKGGVSFKHDAALDPYSLLPKWLQPRKQA